MLSLPATPHATEINGMLQQHAHPTNPNPFQAAWSLLCRLSRQGDPVKLLQLQRAMQTVHMESTETWEQYIDRGLLLKSQLAMYGVHMAEFEWTYWMAEGLTPEYHSVQQAWQCNKHQMTESFFIDMLHNQGRFTSPRAPVLAPTTAQLLKTTTFAPFFSSHSSLEAAAAVVRKRKDTSHMDCFICNNYGHSCFECPKAHLYSNWRPPDFLKEAGEKFQSYKSCHGGATPTISSAQVSIPLSRPPPSLPSTPISLLGAPSSSSHLNFTPLPLNPGTSPYHTTPGSSSVHTACTRINMVHVAAADDAGHM